MHSEMSYNNKATLGGVLNLRPSLPPLPIWIIIPTYEPTTKIVSPFTAKREQLSRPASQQSDCEELTRREAGGAKKRQE